MNAIDMARTAYSAKGAPVRSDQSTEYDVFGKITARMRTAIAQGRAGFPQLVEAMHENRQLWTLIATQVADTENKLPQDLRARLFYLAEFSLTHSADVLRGEAEADVLVEINMTVMRGLRQQQAAI